MSFSGLNGGEVEVVGVTLAGALLVKVGVRMVERAD